MFSLGRLYYLLLQDYARAAFWWRKAGVERGPNRPECVFLADCYWRLGSKPMALDYLNRMSRSAVPIAAIKQLADMGETRSAIQLAEAAARGGYADLAYLYAGDACRIEGQFDQAIGYYDKVLKIEPRGKEGEVKRIKRAQTRADEHRGDPGLRQAGLDADSGRHVPRRRAGLRAASCRSRSRCRAAACRTSKSSATKKNSTMRR